MNIDIYFNVYEKIWKDNKMSLETILFQNKLIVILLDNRAFDNIYYFIIYVESEIEDYKFRKVPIFVVQNKNNVKWN